MCKVCRQAVPDRVRVQDASRDGARRALVDAEAQATSVVSRVVARKKPITSVALLPEDKARLDELARQMGADRSQVITHLLRRALPELPPELWERTLHGVRPGAELRVHGQRARLPGGLR